MSTHKHYHHLTSDYLILFLMLSVGFFSFTKTIGSPMKQLTIGGITAFAYILWGIYHHIHEDDLHWKIVVEYTAFGIIGFSLLWVLLSLFS